MDDKKLLNALQRGDKRAFDDIFSKYAPDVFRFSVGLTKNKPEAEEILQETFVKVWENRKTIDPNRKFRNYLISIAKNLIYDLLRRKVVERKYLTAKVLSTQHLPDIEDDLHLDDLRKLLLDSFNKLTHHQKEILTLKSNGLDNQEIADLLNISKRTVESHLSRAYQNLRADMPGFKDIFHLLPSLIICLL